MANSDTQSASSTTLGESTPFAEVEEIKVEVAYASSQEQRLISFDVPAGTTAYDAVELSHIRLVFPEIDPDVNAMGIFAKVLDGKGKPTPKEYILQAGDRVEIYRPLQIDPMQERKKRAEKLRETKEAQVQSKKDAKKAEKKDKRMKYEQSQQTED